MALTAELKLSKQKYARVPGLPSDRRMRRLQEMIEELSKHADDSDLIALLATSRQRRLHNAALAQEFRDVVEALKRELDRRQMALR
jgi:hypothetical protein